MTRLSRPWMRGLGYTLIGLSLFYVGCVAVVYPLWPWLPLWKWIASISVLGGGAIALAAMAVHIFRNVK